MNIREWLDTDAHLLNCWAANESYTEECCVLKLPAAILDMEMPERPEPWEENQAMLDAAYEGDAMQGGPL